MNESPRSVYRLGAENGLIMGPLMAVTILLTGATAYVPSLFLPALVAMFAVPVAAFIMLSKSFRDRPDQTTFSALWLQGICMFFFGSMIAALVAYAGMRWLCPTFIADQVNTVIEIYGSMDNPDARMIASTLEKALKTHSLPTPIEISLEIIYVAVFSGSILSMIWSLIIRGLRRKSSPTPPPFNQNNQ